MTIQFFTETCDFFQQLDLYHLYHQNYLTTTTVCTYDPDLVQLLKSNSTVSYAFWVFLGHGPQCADKRKSVVYWCK
jgi:hypothetical protein